jgi:hypothetical protein
LLKKSQIEGCTHQNDSDVHHQSFPEMVPENQGIYRNDDGYHRHHVSHSHNRSCHLDSFPWESPHCNYFSSTPKLVKNPHITHQHVSASLGFVVNDPDGNQLFFNYPNETASGKVVQDEA